MYTLKAHVQKVMQMPRRACDSRSDIRIVASQSSRIKAENSRVKARNVSAEKYMASCHKPIGCSVLVDTTSSCEVLNRSQDNNHEVEAGLEGRNDSDVHLL